MLPKATNARERRTHRAGFAGYAVDTFGQASFLSLGRFWVSCIRAERAVQTEDFSIAVRAIFLLPVAFMSATVSAGPRLMTWRSSVPTCNRVPPAFARVPRPRTYDAERQSRGSDRNSQPQGHG